jgi:hypothetical protein
LVDASFIAETIFVFASCQITDLADSSLYVRHTSLTLAVGHREADVFSALSRELRTFSLPKTHVTVGSRRTDGADTRLSSLFVVFFLFQSSVLLLVAPLTLAHLT